MNLGGVVLPSSASHIRETMVNIMARPAIRKPTGVGDDGDEAGAFDGIIAEENQLPMNPSTCIFWSAVALGALVKGYPIEAVRSSSLCLSHCIST